METIKLLKKFNDRIKEIYVEQNLDCVERLDGSHKIHNKQMLSWHSDVSRRCAISNNSHIDYFKNYDEITYCSDEILYFVAHLYMYRPFMNNPLHDTATIGNTIIYRNMVNIGAKRYYMFCDVVLEKFYNYWDRIGDLIASFFPELISERRVFFSTSFDIIPEEYHVLESYNWLKEFRFNGYKDLNGKRKEVVHYTTSINQAKWEHLKLDTEEKIIEWLKNRGSMADYFREHIFLSIEGFYQTLKLLEEVDKVKYGNIIVPN